VLSGAGWSEYFRLRFSSLAALLGLWFSSVVLEVSKRCFCNGVSCVGRARAASVSASVSAAFDLATSAL